MAVHEINWDVVSENLGELRRPIGQAFLTRSPTNQHQPPSKVPRMDPGLDITLCEEKFPQINPTLEGIEDPSRFLIDNMHAKVGIAVYY
jgi:hypothetical protein